MDVSRDLAEVVDGLEPVTLRRRDGTEQAIPHALRRAMFSRRSSGLTPPSRVADVRWHLARAECPAIPEPGDAILDGQSVRWTVLEAKPLSLEGRWLCTCCNLALAFQLDTAIRVLRRAAPAPAATAAEPWYTWRTGIAARFEPLPHDATAEGGATGEPPPPPGYRVALGERLPLDGDCRLVAADGGWYRVTRCLPAQHLGQLDRVDVVPVEPGS